MSEMSGPKGREAPSVRFDAALYLVCDCPIFLPCGSWELDRVSAGGRSHPEAR